MNIEFLMIDYLNNNLTVPAFGEVPKNKPQSFVVIEKTGGGERDRIRSATLAIQSYAPTMAEATRLNETVIEVMRGAIGLPEICACRLKSDYNFTDTAQKQYRYQAVYNVYYY